MKNKIILIAAAVILILAALFAAYYLKIKHYWLPAGNPAERPIER